MARLGFSVIPLKPRDKRPVGGSWRQYQRHRASEGLLREWYPEGCDRNVGIVTGAVSGVVVVDVDSDEAARAADALLPDTPMRTRTAKGEHRFYRHPGGDARIGNRAKLTVGGRKVAIDLRADGGYVVAPGSTHPSGLVYTAVGEWSEEAVRSLPVFDPGWFEPEPEPEPGPEAASPTTPSRAHVGGRPDAVTRARAWLAKADVSIQGSNGSGTLRRVACALFWGFALDDATTLELLREWNPGCRPPWSEQELVRAAKRAAEVTDDPKGRPCGYLLDADREPGSQERFDSGGQGAGSSQGELEKAHAVLEGLAERVQEDIGVALEDDVVAALAVLQERDAPAFVRLKDELRRAKVPLRELGQQLKKQRANVRRRRRQARQTTRPAGPTGLRRQTVVLRENNLTEVVSSCAEAIAANPEIKAFARGDEIVRLVWRTDGVPPVRRLRICEATVTHLRELIEATTDFRRESVDSEGEMRTDVVRPPKLIAEALDARPQPQFPYLADLLDAPTLRPDGSLLLERGYDEESSIYLEPAEGLEIAVPADPDVADAHVAIAALRNPFAEFPFEQPHHRSAALAGLLTLAARSAIPGPVPMTAVTATTQGSGKGLLVDVISIIATGRGAPTTTLAGEEENNKALLSVARAGQRVVFLDNLSGLVRSDALARVLTSTEISGRVLGKSRIVTAPWTSTIFATGNNLSWSSDLARRVLPVHLDPRCEEPELRSFERPALRVWVREHRSQLLSAALTILYAFCLAGRPRPHGLAPLGSYEGWDDLVRGALLWLGEPDPVQAQREERLKNDSDRERLATVLDAWEVAIGEEGVTVGDLAKRLERADARQFEAPADRDLRLALAELSSKLRPDRLDTRILGYAMRRVAGRIIAGRRLVTESAHGNVRRWRLERVEARA